MAYRAKACIVCIIHSDFVAICGFISSDHLKTLTVGIQNFIGQYTMDWGAIGATLMISIMPILL